MAMLRCDLYEDNTRSVLRKGFYYYVKARIDFYQAKRNELQLKKSITTTDQLSANICNTTIAYAKLHLADYVTAHQSIPALKDMTNMVNTRNAGLLSTYRATGNSNYARHFVCASVFFMGYYFAGYTADWLVVTGFIITICTEVFITLNLDRPRRGLINMDSTHLHILKMQDSFTQEEINEYNKK